MTEKVETKKEVKGLKSKKGLLLLILIVCLILAGVVGIYTIHILKDREEAKKQIKININNTGYSQEEIDKVRSLIKQAVKKLDTTDSFTYKREEVDISYPDYEFFEGKVDNKNNMAEEVKGNYFKQIINSTGTYSLQASSVNKYNFFKGNNRGDMAKDSLQSLHDLQEVLVVNPVSVEMVDERKIEAGNNKFAMRYIVKEVRREVILCLVAPCPQPKINYLEMVDIDEDGNLLNVVISPSANRDIIYTFTNYNKPVSIEIPTKDQIVK